VGTAHRGGRTFAPLFFTTTEACRIDQPFSILGSGKGDKGERHLTRLGAWRSPQGRIAMAAGFIVRSRGLRPALPKAACRRVPLYRMVRILDNAGRSANGSSTSMNRNPIPPSAGRHAVGDRSSCRWVVASLPPHWAGRGRRARCRAGNKPGCACGAQKRSPGRTRNGRTPAIDALGQSDKRARWMEYWTTKGQSCRRGRRQVDEYCGN
jgi:hypothetical protein